MKILIDVNLTPEWKKTLENHEIEAVHWSEIGSISAPDKEIMEYAKENQFVVFTHDLDFGTLLFRSGDSKPSVAQLRCDETRPEYMAEIVLSAIQSTESHLIKGALLTIDPRQRRLRVLPLIP